MVSLTRFSRYINPITNCGFGSQEDSLELDLQRVTGNHHFTDKLIFTFTDYKAIKPTCGIHACSESQIFSVKDFSTNYCNVRNLYCGKEDGCILN